MDERSPQDVNFNLVFNQMSEGVAVHELIFDGSGQAVDYRILDVNPAFERLTSINKSEAVNKKASEIYGTGSAPYLDIYARVAISGQAEKFDTYFPPMRKHFSISVFTPGNRKFVTIFTDITEQKTMLNRTQRLNQFLLVLRNVNQLITQAKDDPQHLIDGVCRRLTENCNFCRIWIVVFDPDRRLINAATSEPSEFRKTIEAAFRKPYLPGCVQIAIDKG